MSDYIMDMRKTLNDYHKDFLDNNSLYVKILGERFNDVKKMCYEQEHYPGVYLEDLKVGDRIYIFDCADGYMMSAHYWLEAEITHIYGGVYFYRITDAPTDDEKWHGERHFVSGSILALRNIFPKKVVITKDYEFTCECPRVEFIYDEDMTHTYSSVFENKEERRY